MKNINPNNQEIMFHEEHKEYFYEDFIDGKFVTVWLGKDYIPQEEPKQKALEEAARNTTKIYVNEREKQTAFLEFINGAKWQKEQDKNKYSEENMNEYADYCWRFSNDNRYKSPLSPKDWFEQFKK